MNLKELKTAVRELFDGNHEIANQWVKDNFGNLTRKQTWQNAYDRLSETIAAKADQAANEIIETAKETFTYDNITAAAFTTTATLTQLAQQSVELLVMAGVFTYFLVIELKESGIIDRTLARMSQIIQEQEVEQLIGVKAEPVIAFRNPMLASSIQIAA